MNAPRRKVLAKLLNGIEGKLDELLEVIEEEQEALDNTPESLQESDAYIEKEEALAELIDAQETMAYYIESLREFYNLEG